MLQLVLDLGYLRRIDELNSVEAVGSVVHSGVQCTGYPPIHITHTEYLQFTTNSLKREGGGGGGEEIKVI